MLPFQVFSSITMSGTTQVISSVSTIKYVDNVSIGLQWLGTPQGTFDVQGSVDYNEGTPQSGGGADSGTWTTFTTTTVGSGTNHLLYDLNQLSFPFIRTVYTNSTASGVLNGHIAGKSV